MRNRLTIATVVLLMLVPANAFADEHEVDCYADPTNPACSDVLDDVDDVDDEPEGDVVAEEEVKEASVEVMEVSAETDDAALAETGVSATLFSVIAALMLAAGALLLVVSRRRGSAV